MFHVMSPWLARVGRSESVAKVGSVVHVRSAIGLPEGQQAALHDLALPALERAVALLDAVAAARRRRPTRAWGRSTCGLAAPGAGCRCSGAGSGCRRRGCRRRRGRRTGRGRRTRRAARRRPCSSAVAITSCHWPARAIASGSNSGRSIARMMSTAQTILARPSAGKAISSASSTSIGVQPSRSARPRYWREAALGLRMHLGDHRDQVARLRVEVLARSPSGS